MSEIFSDANIAPIVSRRLLAIVLAAAAAMVATSFLLTYWWLNPTTSVTPTVTANALTTFSLADYATLEGVFCKAPVTGVTRVVTPLQLEEEFGIRIRLVGVTAGGGLIDLRYRVVDLDKALPLLGSHETMPSLVDARSGAELKAPETMMHHEDLKADRTYFMHYPNGGNRIKPGAQVAVVMGDIRVEWITAQ